jgi:signal transduction histidine kinase
VHVIDNGPGIPQAVKEKLFKKGQDTSEDGNSHGLGLYMAKKYTSLLSGTIGLAESEQGSDFYFTVPNVNGENGQTRSAA